MTRLGVAEANRHLARWAARRPNMIQLLPSMIELLLEVLNLSTAGNPQSAQGLSFRNLTSGSRQLCGGEGRHT